jgi:hypothetical protein
MRYPLAVAVFIKRHDPSEDEKAASTSPSIVRVDGLEI